MVARAHAIEDKQARRRAIADAAAGLFAPGAGDLPTVDRIAAAAGVAKGTVYLYFRTREAIFAGVLLDGWGAVMADVALSFAAEGDGAGKVAAFIDRFVGHLAGRPELLRLDALGGAVERNLSRDDLRAFKQRLTERLAAAGAVVDGALGLPAGRGGQLLVRSYALTRGLWQAFDHAEAATLADLSLFRADFPTELAQALAEYWRGALAVG